MSDINTSMDSYQIFLNDFGIDKEKFYEWGISATIFPPVEKAEEEWEALKKRIINNDVVYIRGYGRDAAGTKYYLDFYDKQFGNSNVRKDPSNNTAPKKMIQTTTGLRRNKNIYNYQISHIWGHTKNIYMFEAPWNICYTPKIMDPFTGHETKGSWPDEYQRLFVEKAKKMYGPFIDDYNQIIENLNIKDKLDQYISSLKNADDKVTDKFYKDALNELSPIK